MIKHYTSDEILAMDDFYSDFPFTYQLTQGEIGWLEFITGKYSIADYIRNNCNGDMVLTVRDEIDLSNAMDDDCKGYGKAVMLSDDTALQKIFFYLYCEGLSNEDD